MLLAIYLQGLEIHTARKCTSVGPSRWTDGPVKKSFLTELTTAVTPSGNWAWSHISVIPALGKRRQDDHDKSEPLLTTL